MSEKHVNIESERLIHTFLEYSSLKDALNASSVFVRIDPIPKWDVVGFETDWFMNVHTRDLWALVKGDGPCPAGWSCEYRAINRSLK